jgi:hypothetical protein
MNAKAQREIAELLEEITAIIEHLTDEYGPDVARLFLSRLMERCEATTERREAA